LSEGTLHCERRRQYQDNNYKLNALWDDYKRRTTSSPSSPLAACIVYTENSD